LDIPIVYAPGAEGYQELFEQGNVQGAFWYRKKRPGRNEGLVLAIAGNIFFLILVNETWTVHFLIAGNNPNLMKAWFCQAEEWLYIQDGESKPIFWNGLIPATEDNIRRSDPSKNEMPVGTIMAYCHGRVFVSNAFDQVAASDIIYGNATTDSSATQMFTENTYWAEGGYFGMPTDLGHITGMIVLPRQRANIIGQGELVILCEEGASSLDVSIPRLQWKDAKIQEVTMAGRGPIAYDTVIAVNNDCWFRSDDGLSSYKLRQSDADSSLSLTKLSRQVNQWMEGETMWLKEFSTSIYFDNRIITTVQPQMEISKIGVGSHRFHRGMVVLDLDKASDVTGDASFNWDGLWTGVRPTAMVKAGLYAFIISYDSDGKNRIYRLARVTGNDRCRNIGVQQEWAYHTKRFDWSTSQASNSFMFKELYGGQLFVSDVKDRIDIGVSFRPDNCQTWFGLMPETPFGSYFDGEFLFSAPRFNQFVFGNPTKGCAPGLLNPVNHGSEFQFKVFGRGQVRVDRLRVAVAAQNDPDILATNCKTDDPKKVLDSNKDSDYSYDIYQQSLVNEK
jgi:hypothetical protein